MLKKNTLVNLLKIIDDKNPNLFKQDSVQSRGGWACAWATLLLVGAIVGLVACSTWILCFFAVLSCAAAINSVIDNCYQYIDL